MSAKRKIDNSLRDEEKYFQSSLLSALNAQVNDEFDELWNATADSYPSPAKESSVEQLISQQKEEIYLLQEELSLLKEENFNLREELVESTGRAEAFEKIVGDYGSLLELNRCLTQQLNSIMKTNERRASQIKAIQQIIAF